jgi:hypothetical protein
VNKRFLGLGLLLCTVINIYAWGPRGHKIVAQIARNYLDKGVMDSIDSYLGDITFEKASYWMDEVKMNSSYDFMEPWHFVAIESDKTYVRSKKPDVVNVLENTINTLKRKKVSRNELFIALKVLIHLTADIHQPLHCGFVKDKGGASIKLRFQFKATDLHEVWDSELLEFQKVTVDDCMKLASLTHKNDVIKYQRIDVLKWMEESRALLGTVYDFKGNKLDDEYVDKAMPVVKMQLVKAGMRLAAILNQTFKK